MMNTVFGPVPSRRLGRSLGIDVIPPKTCSYDCVYCESGRTTHLTVARKPFVPVDGVLRELDEYFQRHPAGADVLTFSSAGEPTLYEPLGELIRAVKRRFSSFPVVVLTNGSLLWDAGVRRDLVHADRVVPSLDAYSEDVFQDVNRPHPGIDCSLVMEGLLAFRKEYPRQLHVEVMLVAGRNDHPEELKKISSFLSRLAPDRVELNTVVRPPACDFIQGLDDSRMMKAAGFFASHRTEIIGAFRGSGPVETGSDLESRILEMVRRRPCTCREMASSLGVEPGELEEALLRLSTENRITRYLHNGLEFFCVRPASREKDEQSIE